MKDDLTGSSENEILIKRTLNGNYLVLMTGGFGYTLYSVLMPFFIQRYTLSYQQAGIILSIQSMGACFSSYYGGIINKVLGEKTTLLIGIAGLSAGALVLLFAPDFAVLLVVAVIIGSSQGIISTVTNIFTNNITNQRASSIVMLHACYSIGCTFTPFIVWLALKVGIHWNITIWFCIGMSFFSLISAIQIPGQKNTAQEAVKNGIIWFKEGRYFLLMFLLFVATGTQYSIMGWSSTYFVEMKLLSVEHAQQLLTVLWIMMISGRLANSFLSKYFSRNTLLMGCCIGTFLSVVCGFLVWESPWLALFFVIASFFLAGMYPLIVATAGPFLLHNSTASSLMFALSSFGGVTSSYLCGFVSEHAGIRNSVFVAFVNSFLTLSIALINWFWMVLNQKKKITKIEERKPILKTR